MTAQEEIAALTASVTKATTVQSSAKLLIDGFQARLDAAVAASQANGATVAQLQPLVDLSAAMDSGSDALAASITANTPAAPPA